MKPIVTKSRPVVTCNTKCIRDLTEWKGLQKTSRDWGNGSVDKVPAVNCED